MNDLYAMQRANGDWFAFDDHGRFRVPLFHSSHDAMMARLHNFGMLLFKPVALDARLLREMVNASDARDMDFWLVNDPLVNLNRGRLIEHEQLALLIQSPIEIQMVKRSVNSSHLPIVVTLPKSDSEATESWEDERGRYSKCA